jgi:sensor histidine kinase regulating citrate/malate metabolism
MADGTIKWQIFTIAISFITLNILLYVLIRQISRLQKSKYELKLLEEKMELEKARYNEAGEIWENVRKVRHDMKQHLTVIRGQIEGGDMQGCKSYLENLLPTVERIGKIVRSDNKILDYIINTKLGSLHDTEIVVSGTIGDLSDINELDLACLFGNILDNAVEAIRDT